MRLGAIAIDAGEVLIIETSTAEGYGKART
jgi:hypothetical protein